MVWVGLGLDLDCRFRVGFRYTVLIVVNASKGKRCLSLI